MRIGIDARELCGKPTGVGRHLLGLLGAWSRTVPAESHDFVLYAHETLVNPMSNAQIRIVPGKGGTAWEQLALARAANRDHLDVFFAPGYTAPLVIDAPAVVLVHDISFVARPEWFRWREGLRRRLVTRWSCDRAALVLTVSEFARREILSHFGLAPGRVRRIYPGIAAPGGVREGRQTEPLVLFVGSVFNRRHLPDLIHALKPIAKKRPEVRLFVVGDNRTHPREDLARIAAAEGLGQQVVIRPYAYDDELADLYSRARAFALLSEYEGFGHPPLEALNFGVPSVLGDSEVAREVCGDAALYVPLGDRAATTAALEALLFDDAVRARVLAAGPAVLARYSWSRAAADTLAALEDARRA